MRKSNLPEERRSFWLETGYKNDYPILLENLEADVGVVGGGIAGILSAYRLAKEGYKVVLLEGRTLLSGTTGYTTAKLSAQHQLIYEELINRYDEQFAKLYYEANMEGLAYITEIAKEYNIEEHIEKQRAFVYTEDKNKVSTFKKEAEAYKKIGINGKLIYKIPYDNFNIEAAVAMEGQAQFQPVKFLHKVLDVLKNVDVKIFESSLVEDVEQNKDKDEIKLKTKNGSIVTCSKAVFATHFPMFDPEETYTNMSAEMSYGLALKATQEHPDGMYINDDIPKRTFRKMKDGDENYLLVGGQSHSVGDDRSELERYEELYQAAIETFGESDIVYRWSSHDLITEDRVPFIGRLHPDYPNIFTMTGFNKWGLANAAVGVKVIADIIKKRKNRYEKIYDPQRKIPKLRISNIDSDQTEDKTMELDLVKDPEDLQQNEATIIEENDKEVGIYRDNTGKLHRIDLSCTHLECSLSWNNGDRTWDCPCHGSRFNAIGKVIEGPALEDLSSE